MWSIIGNQALCCSGKMCCAFMCGACMKKCKTKTVHHARFGYIILTLVAIILSLLAIIVGPSFSEKLDTLGLIDCSTDDIKCIGTTTVYRISFSMALFFCMSTFITLIGGEIFSL